MSCVGGGDGDLVPVTIKIELMCCRHIYDDGKRHGYCCGDIDDSYDDVAVIDVMTGMVTDTVSVVISYAIGVTKLTPVTTWIKQES